MGDVACARACAGVAMNRHALAGLMDVGGQLGVEEDASRGLSIE
jgi:hypothetical protein